MLRRELGSRRRLGGVEVSGGGWGSGKGVGDLEKGLRVWERAWG